MAAATIDAYGGLSVAPPNQPDQARTFAGGMTVTRRGGAFILAAGDGTGLSWALSDLTFEPAQAAVSAGVSVNGVRYPRCVALHAVGAGWDGTERFDVVNFWVVSSFPAAWD